MLKNSSTKSHETTNIEEKIITDNKVPEKIKNVQDGYNSADSAIKSKKFDLIVFNPPYCPGFAPDLGDADVALSGGSGGLEVINQFLEDLPNFLAMEGAAFLVTIHHNSPERLVDELNK